MRPTSTDSIARLQSRGRVVGERHLSTDGTPPGAVDPRWSSEEQRTADQDRSDHCTDADAEGSRDATERRRSRADEDRDGNEPEEGVVDCYEGTVRTT